MKLPNWEEILINTIETCATILATGKYDYMLGVVFGMNDIPVFIDNNRQQQDREEEPWLQSLPEDQRKRGAVRLIAYYNLLASLDASVKGTLNGVSAPEFLLRARRAANYGGDARLVELLEICEAALLKEPPEKRGIPVGGHIYDMEDDHKCINGCGCWMGDTRSGGPDGVDPFGECPKAKKAEENSGLVITK